MRTHTQGQYREDAVVMKPTIHGQILYIGVMLVLGIMISFFCAAAPDEEDTSQVDKYEAVFIYKFIGYITWPDDKADTFTIGILGDCKIVSHLKEVAATKGTVNEKALVIRECAKIEDIAGCQIIFISSSMSAQLNEVLKKAEAGNMLTVGSTSGFAEKGVSINFFVHEGLVKFELNLGALKRSGLAVSSQLMKLAKLIDDTRQTEEKGPTE